MNIGVLALQGGFFEHCQTLKQCNVIPVQIKQKEQLEQVQGLIIPGGESTVISNLMAQYEIDKKLLILAKKGFPIFGTCAGAIILSKKILNEKKFKPLSLIDIFVARNSYGRQIDSFQAQISLTKENKKIPGVFIRSPQITKTMPKVKILAELNNQPVMVSQENILASTFHPELSNTLVFHKMLIQKALKYAKK